MIATATYFRAEQRGFAGGYEMEDWISGEAEIDTRLNAKKELLPPRIISFIPKRDMQIENEPD